MGGRIGKERGFKKDLGRRGDGAENGSWKERKSELGEEEKVNEGMR